MMVIDLRQLPRWFRFNSTTLRTVILKSFIRNKKKSEKDRLVKSLKESIKKQNKQLPSRL